MQKEECSITYNAMKKWRRLKPKMRRKGAGKPSTQLDNEREETMDDDQGSADRRREAE